MLSEKLCSDMELSLNNAEFEVSSKFNRCFLFSVAFEEREHILIPEQLSFIMLFLIFDLSQKQLIFS